jgi:uncharacterized protein DUF3991/Toprim domain-containing protein
MFSICASALPCAQRWPLTRELARASPALTRPAVGNGPGGLGGQARSARSRQMAYGAGCPVGQWPQVHQLEPGLGWRWGHRFGDARSAGRIWPSPPMAGTTLRLRHFIPSPSNASNSLPGLAPPPLADNWPRVERYLVQERKLPAVLLLPLVQSGTLYADARGNAVFLLLDTAATPVGAELRGTMVPAWRGMAPGSCKDRGFFSVAASSRGAIVLCESAIDAISCHALHPGYLCLSTSGARPDPAWLPAVVAKGVPIYCGFDADPTGEAMAQRMHQRHPAIHRLRPSAKDWNDLLRQITR